MERDERIRVIILQFTKFLQNIYGMNGSILDLHIHNLLLYLGVCTDDRLAEISSWRFLKDECPVGCHSVCF